MWEILQSGGWLMVPLALCSVAVLTICIERAWVLRSNKIAPPGLLTQVWTQLKENKLDQASYKALRGNSPLGEIVASGLANASHGRDLMKEAIQESATHVIHRLERYLNTLGTIAAIAPLLGLLGTVIGMIKVFSQIMIHGTGNAGLLAGGISEALMTTAAGLSVAIPALIAHRYFSRKIDGLVIRMEQESIKLVDLVHSPRKHDNKAA